MRSENMQKYILTAAKLPRLQPLYTKQASLRTIAVENGGPEVEISPIKHYNNLLSEMVTMYLMAALCNRTGHYIFAL